MKDVPEDLSHMTSHANSTNKITIYHQSFDEYALHMVTEDLIL